ncbi:MAG: hypothetical protein GY856_20435 [bacterium]|nr:hypothetical protein [bacterium]
MQVLHGHRRPVGRRGQGGVDGAVLDAAAREPGLREDARVDVRRLRYLLRQQPAPDPLALGDAGKGKLADYLQAAREGRVEIALGAALLEQLRSPFIFNRLGQVMR